jgi:Tfp pilus assembly protein PilO
MPRKETKILVTTLLFSVIGAFVIFVVLYGFTEGQITDTVKKENQAKDQIVRNDTLLLMKNDIKFGEDNEQALFSYVVPQDGIASLLSNIEGLTASSSLTYTIASLDYESDDTIAPFGLEYAHIDIQVNGSWKNIHHFLDLLEAYPLKINIRNISLDKTAPSGTAGSGWSGDIEFTVLKFKS